MRDWNRCSSALFEVFSIIMGMYDLKEFIAVIFMSLLLVATTDRMFLLLLPLGLCALSEVFWTFLLPVEMILVII